jgi:hypothetical protein
VCEEAGNSAAKEALAKAGSIIKMGFEDYYFFER